MWLSPLWPIAGLAIIGVSVMAPVDAVSDEQFGFADGFDDKSWISEAVGRVINAAQTRRQVIFEKVSETQNDAMHKLFNQLDKNQDGAIQFEEFQGMTLSAWAAFQMMSMETFSMQEGAAMMQEFFRLPSINESFLLLKRQSQNYTIFGMWWRYITFLFFVNILIVIYEHVKSACGFYRWHIPAEPLPMDQIREADRDEVLEYDTPWRKSRYEVMKIIFMTLSGWALLRFIVAFTCFALSVIFINVSVLRDSGLWREVWWKIAQFWIFCLLGALGFYKVHVKGKLAPRESCKLLLGNHVGTYELIALYGLAFPSFVSRSSNMNVPLFNGLVVASDAIMVDRDSSESKEFTLNAIKERVNDPNARQIMIFPEGTTNNQKTIFRFQRGAFSSGKNSVQLVLFKFPYSHFNPCYLGSALGGHELWDLMWRSCCQFVQHMEVQFLPQYMPTDEEATDCTAFADHMQKKMAAHLHSSTNSFSWKLYREARAEYLEQQQEVRRQKRLRHILQDGNCCPVRSGSIPKDKAS